MNVNSNSIRMAPALAHGDDDDVATVIKLIQSPCDLIKIAEHPHSDRSCPYSWNKSI